MNQSDYSQFSALLLTTAAKAYRLEIDEDTVAIYFGALERARLADVAEAIKRHIVEPDRGRWFPTVADIASQVSAVVHERNVAIQHSAQNQYRQEYIGPSSPRGLTAAQVLERIGGDALSRLAAACQRTYLDIEAKHGFRAAQRWYWVNHVEVCNDTQRHGCRAALGRVMDAPVVEHPTLDELFAELDAQRLG